MQDLPVVFGYLAVSLDPQYLPDYHPFQDHYVGAVDEDGLGEVSVDLRSVGPNHLLV